MWKRFFPKGRVLAWPERRGRLYLTACCTLLYKVDMRTRLIAALDAFLILPAALFMAALVLRELPPLQSSAQQFVMWYAGRVWTLWVLLLALPFTVLVTGGFTLLRSWNRGVAMPEEARRWLAAVRGQSAATLFVAATTLAAAGILAIVVLHMAAN